MTINRKLLAKMRELCEEVSSEDGLDPRTLNRSKHRRRRNDRKVLQLCGHVGRTVSMALAASADPILQALTVEAVHPDPDARRLRVDVRPLEPSLSPSEALTHLEVARGRLRAEIARALNRKRTPSLCFGWVPWEVQS